MGAGRSIRGAVQARVFVMVGALGAMTCTRAADRAAMPEDAAVSDGRAGAICDSKLGLVEPLPACSLDHPCRRTAAELDGAVLTEPSSRPTCPVGMELEEREVSGFQRYFCLASPAGASEALKRPLVLWFHPGGEGAETIEETGLIARSTSFDLAGEATRLGFHLAVIQGRNLRFPTREPRDGRHHDFFHRDLGSPSHNPDIAFADEVIDDLVADGAVDGARIYVMGWSNGGFFAQLYTLARANTATPGGSRVAAAAVYATASPFDDVRWDPFADLARSESTSCRSAPPASSVPIMLVYRTCDAAVAATPAQADCFDTEPGYTTEAWLEQAREAGLAITPLRIGGREPGAKLDAVAGTATAAACTSTTCSLAPPYSSGCLCLVNHLMWPDGAYKNQRTTDDHETSMLSFLRDHTSR